MRGNERLIIENKLLKAIRASAGDVELHSLLEYALDRAPIVRAHVTFNPKVDLNIIRALYSDVNPEVRHGVLNYINRNLNNLKSIEDKLQMTLIALHYTQTSDGELKLRAKSIFKRLVSTLELDLRLELLNLLVESGDVNLIVEIVRNVLLTRKEVSALMAYSLNKEKHLLIAENIALGRNLPQLSWRELMSFYKHPRITNRTKKLLALAIVSYILDKGLTDEMCEELIALNEPSLYRAIAEYPELLDELPPQLREKVEEAVGLKRWRQLRDEFREREELPVEVPLEDVGVVLAESLDDISKGALTGLSQAFSGVCEEIGRLVAYLKASLGGDVKEKFAG